MVDQHPGSKASARWRVKYLLFARRYILVMFGKLFKRSKDRGEGEKGGGKDEPSSPGVAGAGAVPFSAASARSPGSDMSAGRGSPSAPSFISPGASAAPRGSRDMTAATNRARADSGGPGDIGIFSGLSLGGSSTASRAGSAASAGSVEADPVRVSSTSAGPSRSSSGARFPSKTPPTQLPASGGSARASKIPVPGPDSDTEATSATVAALSGDNSYGHAVASDASAHHPTSSAFSFIASASPGMEGEQEEPAVEGSAAAEDIGHDAGQSALSGSSAFSFIEDPGAAEDAAVTADQTDSLEPDSGDGEDPGVSAPRPIPSVGSGTLRMGPVSTPVLSVVLAPVSDGASPVADSLEEGTADNNRTATFAMSGPASGPVRAARRKPAAKFSKGTLDVPSSSAGNGSEDGETSRLSSANNAPRDAQAPSQPTQSASLSREENSAVRNPSSHRHVEAPADAAATAAGLSVPSAAVRSDAGVRPLSDSVSAPPAPVPAPAAASAAVSDESGITVSAKKSYREEFLRMEEELDREEVALRSHLSAIAERRAKILSDYRKLLSRWSLLRFELEELKERQENAVLNEDFERADQLFSEMDKATASMQQVDGELGVSESEFVRVEKEWISVTEERSALIERVGARARLLRTRQQDILDQSRSQPPSDITMQQEEVARELASIQRKEKHLSVDLEEIQGRKEDLNKRLEVLTADLKSQRTEVDRRKAVLEDEIAELEAMLAQKKKEHQRVSRSLADIDDRIRDASARFSKDFESIGQEEGSVRTSLKDLEKRKGAATERQRAVQVQLDKFMERERLEQDLLNRIVDFSSKMMALHTEIDTEEDVFRARAKKDTQERKDAATEVKRLQQLRQSFTDLEDEVKVIATQKLRIQNEISTVRQNMNSAEMRLPELENEKKLAVQARNFKEAQRITNEIKQLQTLQMEGELRIQNLQNELESQERSLVVKQQQAATAEAEMKDSEVQFDKKRVLALHYQQQQHVGSGASSADTEFRAMARREQLMLCNKHGWRLDDLVRDVASGSTAVLSVGAAAPTVGDTGSSAMHSAQASPMEGNSAAAGMTPASSSGSEAAVEVTASPPRLEGDLDMEFLLRGAASSGSSDDVLHSFSSEADAGLMKGRASFGEQPVRKGDMETAAFAYAAADGREAAEETNLEDNVAGHGLQGTELSPGEATDDADVEAERLRLQQEGLDQAKKAVALAREQQMEAWRAEEQTVAARHAEVNNLLEAAVAQEDFEAAEDLQLELDSVERRLQELTKLLSE